MSRANPYYTVGKLASAEFRTERARIAGRASNSPDGLITKLVKRADQLTPEHLDRLRALLPPVDEDKVDLEELGIPK